MVISGTAAAALEPWATIRYPQDEQKWWWDADWWERGQMPVPENHAVRGRAAAYRNGDTEIPVARAFTRCWTRHGSWIK